MPSHWRFRSPGDRQGQFPRRCHAEDGVTEAAPFEVSLTREVIRSQPVKQRAEGNVGYIRITGFSRQTQPGLEKAVQTLQHDIGSKLIGYVVDLRNNPGGLLDQAVSVADSFLDKGNVVSTRARDGVETQRLSLIHI